MATIPPALISKMHTQQLSTLRRLILAGESPSPQCFEKVGADCQVFNAYGPTEITVCASAHLYQDGSTAITIGTTIANVQLYVLDPQKQLVPIGVPGELYIGGAGVARGYLNRPELTAERFIDNPFSTKEDKVKGYTRLYRTGDLVRWLPDGNLEYWGRNDQQVKIRGYRIELEEINNVIQTHPLIAQSCVQLQKRCDNPRKIS